MSKKDFLKNIITTASAIAFAIGGTSEAGAAAVKGTAGTSYTNGASWAGGFGFNSGDSILLETSTDNININTGGISIAGIDLNGLTPTGTITATSTGVTIGSIGNGAGTIALIVDDGLSVTLNGTQTVGGVVGASIYSGLGATILGSSTGGTGTPSSLSITATGAVAFSNTFNSYTGATANWGTLNISGAAHSFSGILGGTSKLGAINITDGSDITFSNNVTATSINLNNTAAAITLSGGTTTANITTSGAVGTTAVNISGDSTIAGSIGASDNPISVLHFSTNNTVTISGTQDIYAPIIPYADGKGTLKLSGGTTTLHENVGTFNSNAITSALSSININDQTLVIDASSNDLRIGGSITTATTGSGTLTTQGITHFYLMI